MSKDLNRAMIIGRLGADPEIPWRGSGKALANINVATSDSWMKDGEKQESTEWHRCVCWDALAEICGKYLHKGDQVFMEGSIQTRKWQDKDGQDRYSTEIRVQNMSMLGSPNRGSESHTERPSEPAAAPQDDGFDDIPF